MIGFDLSTIQDVYVGGVGFSYIYYGSNLVWQKSTPYAQQYLTLEALEPGTFGITIKSGTNPSPTYYSLDDGTTWNEFISGSDVSVNTGDKMLLKRDVSTGTYSSLDHTILTSTTNFNVYGNSQSMTYSDNFIGTTDFNNIAYAFSGLFKGNTHLINASNLILPVMQMVQECYENMFYGCTSLTAAPKLPATTMGLGCYANMFYGCTSLTTAPALPATNLYSNIGTNCYQGMFQGCTSLTTAPNLPATTLSDYCYRDMFRGCTSLTTAPALPATTAKYYCYTDMFNGCTSLTTTPNLPATTLATYCYQAMFRGCTSLTTAPALPATTLASYCYKYMFDGCTSLVTAPNLPATTLSDYCYQDMLRGCISLTTAPVLPATTLVSGCYQGMFNSCKSLTKAPALPAETLANNCYYYMFYDCTSLNYIECSAINNISSGTGNWVSGVASTGTFLKNPATSSWTIGVNGIPTGWSVQSPYYDKYLTFTKTSISSEDTGQEIWFNTDDPNADIYYMNTLIDNTWRQYTPGTHITMGGISYPVKFKANGCIGKFYTLTNSTNTNIDVHGNIMSMIYGDDFIGQTTLLTSNIFSEYFKGCKIKYANNLILPATTLTHACYGRMFMDCTSLNTTPTLPATTLAHSCYIGMFNGCTSLTTAPTLPATTLAHSCYLGMFRDCTSLTTAPTLPATTLVNNCYDSMFYGCTSLTTAPVLSATTLAEKCYKQMFNGCTSLTTAPALPATTLVNNCYDSMFNACTSLTTAPELPATTLTYYCYDHMFSNCTSLNYIKCYATDISATDCTVMWTYNVAATGTFYKDSNMSNWTTDSSNGIPYGWTVQDIGAHTVVEYIQHDSSHMGRLDLGVVPNTTMKFEIKFSTDSNSGPTGYAYFGQMSSNGTALNDNRDFRLFVYQNKYYFDAQSYRIISGSTITFNTFHTVELGNNYITDLDTSQTWTASGTYSSIYYTTIPLYLFWQNDPSTLRFAYVKIYDNNVLIHNYIPVLYNNEYTMYDQITDTYCTVSGTLSGGNPV